MLGKRKIKKQCDDVKVKIMKIKRPLKSLGGLGKYPLFPPLSGPVHPLEPKGNIKCAEVSGTRYSHWYSPCNCVVNLKEKF